MNTIPRGANLSGTFPDFMLRELIKEPGFGVFVLSVYCLIVAYVISQTKPLPPVPSDLERVEFLRRGKDGRLWRFSLEGSDAVQWDECLRYSLRSSKGFKELNWKREQV